MIGDIAKKLNTLYKEDPSIYDKYSPEEILEILHQRFDVADEPDDMIYDDEYDDPSELRRIGGYVDE